MANVVHGIGEVIEPPRKRQKLSPSTADVECKDVNLISDSQLEAHKATIAEQIQRETQLGIVCYVNDSQVGFVGIFKQRQVIHVILVNSTDRHC
jgi:hypothetical protein